MVIELEKLKHHPFNSEVYKLSDIDSLKESILNVGLLEPLVINKKNEVISGIATLKSHTKSVVFTAAPKPKKKKK